MTVRKPKITMAIKALLTPTDDSAAIGPDYINRLLDGFEKHRANHARDVAGYFADTDDLNGILTPTQIAQIRVKHLDELLSYTAHDLKPVLLNFIATDDCKRAAVLFLHGHDAGMWKATDSELKWARELVGTEPVPLVKPVATPAPTTPRRAKASPLTWADLGPDAKLTANSKPKSQSAAKFTSTKRGKRRAMSPEMEQAFRLIAANHEFQLAMKDPLANKVEACARLFDTLEREGMGDLVKDARMKALEGKKK